MMLSMVRLKIANDKQTSIHFMVPGLLTGGASQSLSMQEHISQHVENVSKFSSDADVSLGR